jgi:putative methionine-R-sulfoxide reductase with GAF domain
MGRPYRELIDRIQPAADRRRCMQAFVDLLWDALRRTGVSWIGFYLHEGGEQLTLGPRRDKPACSPIGLHGACGQAFKNARPLVVRDVKDLGENYIACDPADRSEIVLPLLDERGLCWGVLDVDSHDVGAFGDEDVDGLLLLLRKAGLTC